MQVSVLVSALLVIVVAVLHQTSAGPGGWGGRRRVGGFGNYRSGSSSSRSSRRYSGGYRSYGRRNRGSSHSEKKVCRAEQLNGTPLFSASCPDPNTMACRQRGEIEYINGRVQADGITPVAVRRYLCEQIECFGECPVGKTCQPLPEDYYQQMKLIYRPSTNLNARYCQTQICNVTNINNAVIPGSVSECPSGYTCSSQRYNCGRGQQTYTPFSGQTYTSVRISRCESNTEAVDPNTEYYNIVNNLGQDRNTNSYPVYPSNPQTGTGTDPDIITVDTDTGVILRENPDEEFPVDPR